MNIKMNTDQPRSMQYIILGPHFYTFYDFCFLIQILDKKYKKNRVLVFKLNLFKTL